MTVTHYIHIGRNKCASTTLQYFFLNNTQLLQDQGLDYFVFGQMADAFPNAPGIRTPEEYAAHIAANPNRSTLISSEELMGPRHRTHAGPLVDALGDAPRRVIAYIRDYSSWVRSTYMQAVMTGRNALDFDAYLRQTEFTVSAMHALRFWARRAGWENMHVRSLDPACLQQGDVLLDCAQAMSLDAEIVRAHRPEPKHVSPHWLCVEIVRFLRASRAHLDWRSFTHGVVDPLRPLIDEAIACNGADNLPVQYMTPEQSERLTEIYNADVFRLSFRTGANVTGTTPQFLTPRPFLPSIEHVPIEVLRTLMTLADAHFQDASAPARAALGAAFRWARDGAKPAS
jgi:hypothetical protein